MQQVFYDQCDTRDSQGFFSQGMLYNMDKVWSAIHKCRVLTITDCIYLRERAGCTLLKNVIFRQKNLFFSKPPLKMGTFSNFLFCSSGGGACCFLIVSTHLITHNETESITTVIYFKSFEVERQNHGANAVQRCRWSRRRVRRTWDGLNFSRGGMQKEDNKVFIIISITTIVPSTQLNKWLFATLLPGLFLEVNKAFLSFTSSPTDVLAKKEKLSTTKHIAEQALFTYDYVGGGKNCWKVTKHVIKKKSNKNYTIELE